LTGKRWCDGARRDGVGGARKGDSGKGGGSARKGDGDGARKGELLQFVGSHKA